MGNLLKACDIFGTPQFTLYRGKDQFTTKAGGIASILTFGVLLAIFAGMSIEILNSRKIFVNMQSIYDAIPLAYNITANPDNKFMIAIGMTAGIDYNKSIGFYLQKTDSGVDASLDLPIPLQKCNLSHWKGVNPSVEASYHQLQIQNFLCIPLGQQLQLYGGLVSEYGYFSIIAKQCTGDEDISYCIVPKNTLFDTYSDSRPQISIYMLNTVINPSKTTPLTYYIENIVNIYLALQNKNYLTFDLEEFILETDYSLMPWAQIQLQRGIKPKGYSQQQVQIDSNLSKGTVYADIKFVKSSRRTYIWRSFSKVTEAISFVGGLVTPVMLLMSIMRVYNRFSYEIEFGYRIFKPNKNSWFSAERFNFYYFLKYGVYSMLKGLRLYPKWEQIKEYQECRAEAVKQLDIYLLFKKIENFQEVCSTILEKHHQIGLHLVAKKTLKETRKKRKAYLMRDFIYGKIQKLQNFVTLEKEQVHKQTMQFFGPKNNQINFDEKPTTKEVLDLQNQFAESYKRLHQESKRGCAYSKRIIERIKKNNEDTVISMDIDFPIDQQKEEVPNSSEDYLSKNEEIIQQS